ncbi:MAG: SDR family oxidoreductase, partial [Acidimicrobiales bacterium]
MIKDQLAGKRIAVTGATGFLGTALVERLLRSAPDCELVLIVRPTRRSDPARRIKREVLKNNAFDRLREELGDDFDLTMSRRIVTTAGDVAKPDLGLDDAGRAALAGCDIFIHSAATVSFDSPLDASVSINLLGPNNIIATLQDLGVQPHLVAVSTCYVAGSRRGDAAEEFLTETPFHVEVDWRAEVVAAERSRGDVDAESRMPEQLTKFRKDARSELGAAGTPLLAAKTEQLRAKWVNERMVDLGRARASSLGWPDVYTYSKALGETALIELHGDIPVTVVRPSIIESALYEPYPGWIRGFRMAEPIIVSYAKGELHQFPGSPESVIDVIPVDIVANTIIAAAAEPAPDEPQVYQVASGAVNPLEYRVLTDTDGQIPGARFDC